jgi:hypothetical protein
MMGPTVPALLSELAFGSARPAPVAPARGAVALGLVALSAALALRRRKRSAVLA